MMWCRFTWLLVLLAGVRQQAAQAQASDIRLNDRQGATDTPRGRLEIFINGEWGSVCDDDFETTEAGIACRQLGFEDAAYFDRVDKLAFARADGNVPILLDDLWCEPTDNSIQDCSHSGVGNHNCVHGEVVGLACLTNGTLRLVHDIFFGLNGYGQNELHFGRLEIYINGQWGTICDTDFGEREADTACQLLGFSGADYFGPVFHLGTSIASDMTPIWLDDVACSPDVSSLLDCDHSPVGTSSCSHWQDVGVVCSVEYEDEMVGLIIAVLVGVLGAIGTIATPTVIVICVLCALYSNSQQRMGVQSRGPTVTNTAHAQTAPAYPIQRTAVNVQQGPPPAYPQNQPYLTQPGMPQANMAYPPQVPGQPALYPVQVGPPAPYGNQ